MNGCRGSTQDEEGGPEGNDRGGRSEWLRGEHPGRGKRPEPRSAGPRLPPTPLGFGCGAQTLMGWDASCQPGGCSWRGQKSRRCGPSLFLETFTFLTPETRLQGRLDFCGFLKLVKQF